MEERFGKDLRATNTYYENKHLVDNLLDITVNEKKNACFVDVAIPSGARNEGKTVGKKL